MDYERAAPSIAGYEAAKAAAAQHYQGQNGALSPARDQVKLSHIPDALAKFEERLESIAGRLSQFADGVEGAPPSSPETGQIAADLNPGLMPVIMHRFMRIGSLINELERQTHRVCNL